MASLVHSAERAAFGKILDNILEKGQTKSPQETFGPLLNIVKKIMGDSWSDLAYKDLQEIIDNPTLNVTDTSRPYSIREIRERKQQRVVVHLQEQVAIQCAIFHLAQDILPAAILMVGT